MNKTKWVYGVLTLVLMLALNFPAASSGQVKAVNLRIADELNPDEPPAVGGEEFARTVESLSNGKYKIVVYHKGQLGTERELIEQIRQGVVDVGVISSAPMGTFAPSVNLLQLPFLEDSLEIILKVSAANLPQKVLGQVEALGMKVLKMMDGGLRFMVTVRPVKTLEDVKGLKFRTAQNQMHMDIFAALGASPTPMAYGEIYTGLQNKVIDGCENDIFGITSKKFYEVAKNVTLTGHFSWPMMLVVSSKTWDKIPETDRDFFLKGAQKALEINNKILLESQNKLFQQIKDAKTNIIELSDAERVKFRKAVQPVYDKYATDQTAKDFVAAVEKLKQK